MASYNGSERSAGTRPDSALEVIECSVRATSASSADAPVISNVTPASGSSLTNGASISFDLTDPSGASDLSEFFVVVKLPASWEVAYDLNAAAFGPQYTGARSSITNGYSFSLARVGGWGLRAGQSITVLCLPRDAAGLTSS